MANWSDLKAAVASIVKTNGNKEISGQLLQNVLNNIISNVGLNSSFAGIATPEINPGTPDGNVFYIATTAGTYSNFNGILIQEDEAVILEWRGSWTKKSSGFATQENLSKMHKETEEKLSELDSKANDLEYKKATKAELKAESDRAKSVEERLDNVKINKSEFEVYKTGIDNKVASQDNVITDFKEAVTVQVNNYRPIEINGNVTNAADEEDITSENRLLKLKDRSALNGMGHVILRKNKSFAEQVTLQNTIYEIRYDFDLNGAEITIPEGCVLDFQGGSFSNGTIKGANTFIVSNQNNKIFKNIQFNGSYANKSIELKYFDSIDDVADLINEVYKTFDVVIVNESVTVNRTIFLTGGKTLRIEHNVTLTKTANSNSPMIHVEGNSNSIEGNGKTSMLHSTVSTPNGLIAMADYDYYQCKIATFFNRFNNIYLHGVISEDVQSFGLYLKGTYTPTGRYFNTFSNLLISSFNVGIGLFGDLNGNYFRDITFYNVGTAKNNETKELYHYNDAAILFKSLDINGKIVRQWENQFTQMFHSNSEGATSIYFEDEVIYEYIQMVTEPGGNAYYLKQKGVGARDNIIEIIGVTMMYRTYEDPDFLKNNQIIDSQSSRIRQLFVGTDAVIGRDLTFGEYGKESDNYTYKKSLAEYRWRKWQLKDGLVYKLFDFDCGIANNNCCIIDLQLFSSTNSNAQIAAHYELHIYKQNSEIKVSIKQIHRAFAVGLVIKEPKIEGNVISIYCRPSYVGNSNFYANLYLHAKIYQAVLNGNSIEFAPDETSENYEDNLSNLVLESIGNNRPTNPLSGDTFFDKSINKPIWWTGSKWVDATGADV